MTIRTTPSQRLRFLHVSLLFGLPRLFDLADGILDFGGVGKEFQCAFCVFLGKVEFARHQLRDGEVVEERRLVGASPRTALKVDFGL